MSTSKHNLVSNEWEMSTIERKYSMPPGGSQSPSIPPHQELQPARGDRGSTSEDLHAWSIYRQNLNSDFTDSALGSSEKSPLPYGNFQLRESTVQSILSHPRYGPKSALSSNMYTYLKFGLPRVFPPSRGLRDGSSGYNSSDDGSPGPIKGNRPIRTRSEIDFRNLQMHSSYSRQPPQSRNGRMSNSEANLLSVSAYCHDHPPRSRRSVSGMERGYRPSELRPAEHRKSFHDLRSAAMMESSFHRPLTDQRRASKTGSHISLNHRKIMSNSGVPEFVGRPHSAMGQVNPAMSYYGTGGGTINGHSAGVLVDGGPFQYPHFQVKNLDVETRKERGRYLLQSVSLEARGGELLSVMSTQTSEGTLLLSALSGQTSSKHGKITGEFILNGNLVDRKELKKRSAVVKSDGDWDSDLTVKQTLYFQHRLRRVKHRFAKLPLDDKISSLMEDLGLDHVSDTKLSGLTKSELRRLSVATYLLLDVDILFLDQPTKGMDIFDTFFLIEYLRQWALNTGMPELTGRIVILTLQPPTYEILTMISKVLIVSNGHVMYSGATSMLLPYFTSVEYPCPPFKNPSDYYLDLVTLDDLSAEAMLESSQRMAQLGDLHKRRQQPLSDPGPPAHFPPELVHSNPFSQAFTLFLRSFLWSQPSSFVRYLFQILLAAILSFLVGAVFWDIPGSDTQLLLGDRLGFHYTVFCVTLWPLILLTSLNTVRRERRFVLNEIKENLYGRTVFVVMKVICGLPGSLLMWLSYLVPSFIMSGLHYQGSNAESTKTFYLYIGLSLLYLHALQLLSTGISWLFRNTLIALFFIFLLFTTAFTFSGFPIHADDTGAVGNHIKLVSPTYRLTSTVLQRELRPDAFKEHNHVCRNKQRQRPEIIVQVACPTPNGTAELEYLNMLPGKGDWLRTNSQTFRRSKGEFKYEDTFLFLGIFWVVSFLLLWIFFSVSTVLPAGKRNKIVRSANKP
ncbi:hypothetical protein RUM43_006794 [Polyplax serrata]|uniref:ABC transporter domain-containing protein n=1 Tax=Polyplax serrata TaxID=468196 RepID=A0AAN8PW76_POLSC